VGLDDVIVTTNAGSWIDANGTHTMPSAKVAPISEAIASASRDLPMPPLPVSVKSRTSSRRNSMRNG